MISFITAVNNFEVYNRCWNAFKKKNPNCQFITIEGAQSIAEAYNRGLDQVEKGIICFAHQDAIILNTNTFVSEMKRRLDQKKVGGVFFVGSPILGPGKWSWGGSFAGIFYQGDKLIKFSNEDKYILAGDGFCFLSKIKNIRFDEEFKGWHFYDLLYGKALAERGLVSVCPGVPMMRHLSDGNFKDPTYIKEKPLFISKMGMEPYVIRQNLRISRTISKEAAERLLHR